MGIYIKGIKMPTSGELLVIITPNGDVRFKKSVTSKWDKAIVVSVPPHGRLIDVDALNYKMLYKEDWIAGTGVEAPAIWKEDIESAPTIIPAEEEMK